MPEQRCPGELTGDLLHEVRFEPTTCESRAMSLPHSTAQTHSIYRIIIIRRTRLITDPNVTVVQGEDDFSRPALGEDGGGGYLCIHVRLRVRVYVCMCQIACLYTGSCTVLPVCLSLCGHAGSCGTGACIS